jgi:hypothetical protein
LKIVDFFLKYMGEMVGGGAGAAQNFINFYVPSIMYSVAEPVHFCAAPAPAQLVKNFGSGSNHFPHIFSKKIKNFHGFKTISRFLNQKLS